MSPHTHCQSVETNKRSRLQMCMRQSYKSCIYCCVKLLCGPFDMLKKNSDQHRIVTQGGHLFHGRSEKRETNISNRTTHSISSGHLKRVVKSLISSGINESLSVFVLHFESRHVSGRKELELGSRNLPRSFWPCSLTSRYEAGRAH